MQQLNANGLDIERGQRDLLAVSNVQHNVPSMDDNFVVSWKNLTYVIEQKPSMFSSATAKSRTILSSLNGQIQSGELTALMGPSGAGKSTLLECIASIRKKGRFGEVTFLGQKKVNVSFIPQQDHYMSMLTGRTNSQNDLI